MLLRIRRARPRQLSLLKSKAPVLTQRSGAPLFSVAWCLLPAFQHAQIAARHLLRLSELEQRQDRW